MSFAHPSILTLFLQIHSNLLIARRVSKVEVNGARVRGRPRLGWMDRVHIALRSRGMRQ